MDTQSTFLSFFCFPERRTRNSIWTDLARFSPLDDDERKKEKSLWQFYDFGIVLIASTEQSTLPMRERDQFDWDICQSNRRTAAKNGKLDGKNLPTKVVQLCDWSLVNTTQGRKRIKRRKKDRREKRGGLYGSIPETAEKRRPWKRNTNLKTFSGLFPP